MYSLKNIGSWNAILEASNYYSLTFSYQRNHSPSDTFACMVPRLIVSIFLLHFTLEFAKAQNQNSKFTPWVDSPSSNDATPRFITNDSLAECMVVPDDWSVVHTRFIVDHPHGIFRRGILVGSEIYERYVICVSSKWRNLDLRAASNDMQFALTPHRSSAIVVH